MSETASDTVEWQLKPGDQIERKALHSTFGGRTQGGIGPSAKTPNVFVFTDPVAGEKHGYYDDWMPDGRFHYSGEGQYGDQRMISGNASILNHQAEGRALRVFQGARGTVTYRGEFTVDQENPWYSADAPETNDGPLRKVIVFRLNPVDTAPQEPATKLGRLLVSHPNQVDDLPLERNESETTFVNPNREPYEADRKEARLVKAFADYLTSNGHQSGRQRILPPAKAAPLYRPPRQGTRTPGRGQGQRHPREHPHGHRPARRLRQVRRPHRPRHPAPLRTARRPPGPGQGPGLRRDLA